MTLLRSTIILIAYFVFVGLPTVYAQQPAEVNRSFDPTTESAEKTSSPLLDFLVHQGITVLPITPVAPGLSSYSLKASDGALQSIHVLADGLTFISGSIQDNLRQEDMPHAPDVIALGAISAGIEGWIPRAWIEQSQVGVLYTVPGTSLPIKGYAYRFFPGRDIMDNLSAIQLANIASSKPTR